MKHDQQLEDKIGESIEQSVAQEPYLCCNKCGKLYQQAQGKPTLSPEELVLIEEYADIIAESILWPYLHDEHPE